MGQVAHKGPGHSEEISLDECTAEAPVEVVEPRGKELTKEEIYKLPVMKRVFADRKRDTIISILVLVLVVAIAAAVIYFTI